MLGTASGPPCAIGSDASGAVVNVSAAATFAAEPCAAATNAVSPSAPAATISAHHARVG